MKVVSLVVEGLEQAQKAGLFDWLHEEDADIVCLQEVRREHRREAAYFRHWPSQPQAEYLAPEGYEAIYRTNAITRQYRPLLKEIGLTYPQYLVLLILWEHGSLQVGEIAGLDVERGAMIAHQHFEIVALIAVSRSAETVCSVFPSAALW